ncbi:MAG: NADH-quinone oxidoreductase subunit C [Thermoguttaceae bacterium]|jgi:NADH-quinone oxidoreductase subunit C
MDIQGILQRIVERFGSAVTGQNIEAIDPWIEIAAAEAPEIGLFLRDEPDLRFNMLLCITAVDYFEADAKKAAAADWQPHVELIYHLSSLPHRHRLTLKVRLPRWKDDTAGRLPEVPSVHAVWSTADWHEREVYDLSGVRFLGHPDLRRILLPEDWEGHPLRRDYQTPLEYHGIRGR